MGHITIHVTIAQITCTEEQPPRQIINIVWRKGANNGSYQQTMAVQAGLKGYIVQEVTRLWAPDPVPDDILAQTKTLFDNISVRVSRPCRALMAMYPDN